MKKSDKRTDVKAYITDLVESGVDYIDKWDITSRCQCGERLVRECISELCFEGKYYFIALGIDGTQASNGIYKRVKIGEDDDEMVEVADTMLKSLATQYNRRLTPIRNLVKQIKSVNAEKKALAIADKIGQMQFILTETIGQERE